MCNDTYYSLKIIHVTKPTWIIQYHISWCLKWNPATRHRSHYKILSWSPTANTVASKIMSYVGSFISNDWHYCIINKWNQSQNEYMRNTLPIKHPCAVSAGLVALSDNPSSGPEWYMSARSAEIKIKQCSGQHDELQTAESPLKMAWVEKVGYDGRQDVWQTKETFIEERFIHHMKMFNHLPPQIKHQAF